MYHACIGSFAALLVNCDHEFRHVNWNIYVVCIEEPFTQQNTAASCKIEKWEAIVTRMADAADAMNRNDGR